MTSFTHSNPSLESSEQLVRCFVEFNTLGGNEWIVLLPFAFPNLVIDLAIVFKEPSINTT
jgi:hypothetical protein